MTVYLLNETYKDGSETTLGVFDSPFISDETLISYFGPTFEKLEMRNVEDSGIEWVMDVKCDDEIVVLTLHYFEINEL